MDDEVRVLLEKLDKDQISELIDYLLTHRLLHGKDEDDETKE